MRAVPHREEPAARHPGGGGTTWQIVQGAAARAKDEPDPADEAAEPRRC